MLVDDYSIFRGNFREVLGLMTLETSKSDQSPDREDVKSASGFFVVDWRPPSKTLIAAAGQRLFFRVPKPVEILRLPDARYFAG